MRFVGDLRILLGFRDFRRLFAVRLGSQLSDGIFQVALASFVLFSPERQPDAGAIAATFAVLLLPFSILGPFCGVLLDRWSRRQILLYANLARAVLVVPIAVLVASGVDGAPFYVLVLVCLSVNRFVLAGLSASLPHVVPGDRLVMANAVSPTCGTLAVLVGLGLGSVVARSQPEAVVLALGSVGYLGASLLALRIPRPLLGPDLAEARPAVQESVHHILRGLRDGFRHVLSRRQAAAALAVIGAHRFGYGIATVAGVLMFRNLFHPGDTRAGFAGMAMVVLCSGIGYAGAALATPFAVRRMSKPAWMMWLLVLASIVQVFPTMLFTPHALFAAAVALGLVSQGMKICVDTIVQESVDDVFRGRVFTLYDMLFNVVFVLAAVVSAVTLPETGRSYAVLALVAVGYLAAAFAYSRLGSTAKGTLVGRRSRVNSR